MKSRLGSRIEAMFDAEVAEHPDRVAVEYGNESLTYRQVLTAAKRTAAALAARGVRPGDRVAVLSHRSLYLPAALLGILKAGAAYMPLDPDLPVSRLEYLKQDAELAVLVTHGEGSTEEAFGQLFASQDTIRVEHTKEGLMVQAAGLSSADAAYVMYTSGSTGAPKGVEVRHDGVVHLVDRPDYVRLDERTVMLHSSPLSFDASTLEIWGPLLNGGRLVLYPESRLSLDGLRTLLEARPINTMVMSTRVFDRFVQARKPDPCHLEFLLFGGEVASPLSVESFYETYDHCTLINVYGPTETTTLATCYRVPRNVRFKGSVPIGVPISGTDVYLVTERGELAAEGEPGEIWIGGPGVAKGYLRRPELTAERFMACPWSRVPGELLYRTGDRARRLPDGNLDFIGRLDGQVKVSGHRIEPPEVEHAIACIPGVQSSFVTAVRDHAGDTRLVAYVATTSSCPPLDQHHVREALSAALPAYMIPSIFVMLEQMPLKQNGKVDKAALPPPRMDTPSRATSQADHLEGIIASAWCQVLELPQIDVDKDFTALGGDSLRAMSVALILEKRHGISVDMAMMDPPVTVRSMCKQLSKRTNDDRQSCLVDTSAPSDTLLICFTGGGLELMMPPFDFLVSIRGLDTKRILLRDFERAFYHRGIEGHCHDIETTRAFLAHEISRARVRRVVMLGTSMGGYAALLYGLLCGAHAVHAFAPITELTANMYGYDVPGRVPWKDVFPKLDRRYFNLASHYRAASVTPRCELYVGSFNSMDVNEVNRLRGCPGVRVHFRPTADHNIASFMQQRGQLTDILKGASKGAPAASDTAASP